MLSLGAAAAWLSGGAAAAHAQSAGPAPVAPLPPAPARPDEVYWRAVRAQFTLAPELALLNAANLCPAPRVVSEVLRARSESIERDPSFENRKAISAEAEAVRGQLAAFLSAAPEEIVITRNTSEANNMVSLGLELAAGDEVILFSDNHPSNKAAWQARAKRHGFTIVEIPIVTPYPGPEHYLAATRAKLTARTKLIGFSHLTNTAGDLFPARELCALAREHGVLSLVDGAQSFGLLAVDLAEMRPDFFTGSAHKWPCGPKEVGVLFAAKDTHARLWPSVVSAGGGPGGLAKTHEGLGQRDEAAIVAFGTTLTFHDQIGRAAIEARARTLAQQLMAGLRKIDGVKLWTNPDPALSAAVVVFQAGDLDPARLAATLYRLDRIACAPRASADRPGLRMSPHFYNQPEEIERALAAIRGYVKNGLPG